LCIDVFGRPAAEHDDFAALSREVPCLWVTGKTDEAPLGGMLVWATTAPGVASTGAGGRVVGRTFHDGEVTWCRLGGLRPLETTGSPAEQTQATFSAIESELARAGMRFANVLRTWFYNDEILAWYGDFNRVRTAFFQQHGVFEGLVPASTGIGGRNPAGTALNVGLLALRTDSPDVRVTALPSPLQCAALQYGSSFSRAVEVSTPTHRRVWVSGTASIEPGGKSVHQGDVEQQIVLTMKVVLAILESRGLGWSDVVRGVAYLRHHADAPKWTNYLAAHGLQDLPVVTTENVVCRDDLLFEIEVDAIRLG
jgi:enamine deaminase RidA (YjgF/YER057c/UK114 family)